MHITIQYVCLNIIEDGAPSRGKQPSRVGGNTATNHDSDQGEAGI